MSRESLLYRKENSKIAQTLQPLFFCKKQAQNEKRLASSPVEVLEWGRSEPIQNQGAAACGLRRRDLVTSFVVLLQKSNIYLCKATNSPPQTTAAFFSAYSLSKLATLDTR